MQKLNTDVLNHIVDFAYPGQGALVYASVKRRHTWWKYKSSMQEGNAPLSLRLQHAHPFQIYIRKRPLIAAERSIGVYDVVDTDIDARDDAVMVHNGQLARNGRRLTMAHKHYSFSRVLGAEAPTSEFCRIGIEPLIDNALTGLSSTLLCYGQTGTGK
jgi:hypothetical protein